METPLAIRPSMRLLLIRSLWPNHDSWSLSFAGQIMADLFYYMGTREKKKKKVCEAWLKGLFTCHHLLGLIWLHVTIVLGCHFFHAGLSAASLLRIKRVCIVLKDNELQKKRGRRGTEKGEMDKWKKREKKKTATARANFPALLNSAARVGKTVGRERPQWAQDRTMWHSLRRTGRKQERGINNSPPLHASAHHHNVSASSLTACSLLLLVVLIIQQPCDRPTFQNREKKGPQLLNFLKRNNLEDLCRAGREPQLIVLLLFRRAFRAEDGN